MKKTIGKISVLRLSDFEDMKKTIGKISVLCLSDFKDLKKTIGIAADLDLLNLWKKEISIEKNLGKSNISVKTNLKLWDKSHFVL